MDDIYLGPGQADYENIRPLGSEGGLGDLFRAHKKGLDVEVVIKRVKNSFRGRLDQENEANILKGLKHQYLPRIYDVIPGEDGYIYTIMDYIPGVDLQEYVRQHGRVNQKLAHKWACQLCEVVAYLHAQTPPIIHCDIKPHNVMITPQDNICLIDFNTSLKDGAFMGAKSHGYAAPEQYGVIAPPPADAQASAPTELMDTAMQADIPTELMDEGAYRTSVVFAGAPAPEPASSPARARGPAAVAASAPRSFTTSMTVSANKYGGISKRTDVYAIGATLYFVVSGQKPQRSLDEVTPLKNWKPAISAAFLSIIRRAMEKPQESRFSDAQEMLRALRDVDQMDQRLRHFMVVKRIALAAIVLLWLAAAGSTAYGWYSMTNERGGRYLSLVSQGEAYDQAGQYEEGRALLQQAIDMQPARGEAYNSLAALLYHQGQYQEAVNTLEDALASEALNKKALEGPLLGSLYYIEGSCYYELAQYEKAAAAYEDSLANEAGNAAAYRGLAMAQARMGDLEAAQRTLARVQEMGAGAAEIAMIQAEIFAMQGDVTQALACYEQCYSGTDDMQMRSHAYLAAAQLTEQTGQLYQSAAILESAAANLPAARAGLHRDMLATVYSEIAAADPAVAEEYYGKALALLRELAAQNTATVVTQLNLAVVQQALERFPEAEATLLAALEAYPYDYRVDMRLAYLYAAWQGTLENARRDYKKVEKYYETANEKYQQALANGREDPEMIQLKNVLEQLRGAGWLA